MNFHIHFFLARILTCVLVPTAEHLSLNVPQTPKTQNAAEFCSLSLFLAIIFYVLMSVSVRNPRAILNLPLSFYLCCPTEDQVMLTDFLYIYTYMYIYEHMYSFLFISPHCNSFRS